MARRAKREYPPEVIKTLTVKERIVYYLYQHDTYLKDFYRLSGLHSSSFAEAAVKKDILVGSVVQFLKVFPSCSLEWLILGVGTMDNSPDNSYKTVSEIYQAQLADKDHIISILQHQINEQQQRIDELRDLYRLMKQKEKSAGK